MNLALQGGGSHGALTWGVLDRLLDEPCLDIRAVSGTSAGAMNAAALVSGLATGGREGARATLERFWSAVSDAGRIGPYGVSLMDVLVGVLNGRTEVAHALLGASRQVFSPYDMNAGGRNPLRAIIEETIDIDAIAAAPVGIHVTATNVRTGQARIFSGAEVTIEALLASACLPTLFQAVEIEGEEYWDGGFTGNPSLTPLLHGPGQPDLVVVQINPTERRQLPRSAQEIANREKEITFNDPLIKEFDMIAGMQKRTRPVSEAGPLIAAIRRLRSRTGQGPLAGLRTHRISSDEMNVRPSFTKLHSDRGFLRELREEGRSVADAFLSHHGRDLGRRSSFDPGAALTPEV